MTKWEKARRTGEEEGHEYRAKFKSSIRNDKYQMCVENGIGELAGRFGLTAKQFAENLDWRKHDIEQDTAFPLDAAEEYICPAFMDRETVLNGAKFMLAKEISRQPLVRNRIRQEFRNNAHFWVKPTKKGRETIDESHPLFDKRYIKVRFKKFVPCYMQVDVFFRTNLFEISQKRSFSITIKQRKMDLLIWYSCTNQTKIRKPTIT